jgi:hypothetical protein
MEHRGPAGAQDLPREDILCVVVAEVHLGRPADGNALGMVIEELKVIRF